MRAETNLKHPFAKTLTLALGAWALAAWPAPEAVATDAQMRDLPTFESYGCQNCHDGSGVTTEFVPADQANQLNDFGEDWVENGRIWNRDLAQANSDGDGCTNGFELSDPNGEWRPGFPRPTTSGARNNPGAQGDCALPLNEETWGTLKALFGED